MTELEIGLREIQEERQEKIIPTNIKKGVKIFDVEGSYEENTPIYTTTQTTQSIITTTTALFSSSYQNITIFKNYTFVCHNFISDSSTQKYLSVYENTNLLLSTSIASFVNTASTNGRIVILKHDEVNQKIYFGMPYITNEYGTQFSIGYYDIKNNEITYLKTTTLNYEIYYSSGVTFNGWWSQYWFDNILLITAQARNTYGPWRYYDFDLETEDLVLRLTGSKYSQVMVAPMFMLNPSGELTKITTDGSGTYKTKDITSPISGKNIHGVSFDGTKIFIGGNIYALNEDLTVGELIKEGAYTPNNSYVLKSINEKYYGMNTSLYEFDAETNTFTELESGLSYYGGIYKIYDSKTLHTYAFGQSEKQIGFIYKDGNYYFKPYDSVSEDVILINNHFYTPNGQRVDGTMPNNGALDYTPSGEAQTIPAGYTSGGTIGAINYNELGTITPEENTQAQEQINDLFGEGETE